MSNLVKDDNLDVEIIHAGHEPSFGRAQMKTVIDQYLIGKNIMPTDPIIWFNKISSQNLDHYCTQNWVRAKKMIEDSLLKPKC